MTNGILGLNSVLLLNYEAISSFVAIFFII
jgi:hypothetical protein